MEGGIGLLLLSRVGTDSRIRDAGFSLPRRLFRHPADSPFAFRRPPPPAKLISSNGSPPTNYAPRHALFQLEHTGGNSIIFENFRRDFSRVWIVYPVEEGKERRDLFILSPIILDSNEGEIVDEMKFCPGILFTAG